MKQKSPFRRPLKERLLSGLLAFAMTLGYLPTLPSLANDTGLGQDQSTTVTTQSSGHWSQPFIDKMLSYGYMRPEQAVDPDATLTRADFISIVNRAYGYHEVGENPYTDVSPTDWFYEDVLIASKVNYIAGTSPTTVEPYSPLTRETTAYILGINMMLPESTGENMFFTDTREISDWSRGMVKSTSEMGLMVGYTDGSFRPKNNITCGEISALILQAVGTPVLEAGEVELGEVFGNVTITEPGTILKNTIIAGDLYISNGIGLGDVTLENVTVLGRIVVSGGLSEDGDASIVLRNVTADEMVVDNLRDQMVTIRAEGNTVIGETTVRQSTYIEDNTPADKGLLQITFEAPVESELALAGRVKNVTNKSPGTLITVAAGSVDQLTIDEEATEAVTEVLRGALLTTVNLDTASTVMGEGDVENANINAPGGVLTMLPDNVYIRPGLSANVNGEDIDSLTASELSEDPRILSGYPKADDIAPSEFDAVFATNKPGTLYWAISTLTQGSVPEEQLIKPPSYGGIALQSGSVEMELAEEEVVVHITDLAVGGNYYLSAVFVDGRGDISAVKITAFSTPDDTIPEFNEGFPYLSQIEPTSAWVTAMASKSCVLYYVVMQAGAVPPTPDEFLSGAISGAAGSGMATQVMTKNKENSQIYVTGLDEQKDYVFYLWLTDANNANASEVVGLPFTTKDGTNPYFVQHPQASEIAESSVGFTFSLSEDATFYYVAVPQGTVYPKPEAGQTTANLGSTSAKMQVAQGLNGGIGSVTGSVSATGEAIMSFTVAGLEKESGYTLYYVAQDAAGNYSDLVYYCDFNTLDESAPEYLGMSFNRLTDPDRPLENPEANTDIFFTFSESVQSTPFYGYMGDSFINLYSEVVNASTTEAAATARDNLATALANCFIMYEVYNGTPNQVTERNTSNNGTVTDTGAWTIDYRYATVTYNNEGNMVIGFPTTSDEQPTNGSALNMASGATYYFTLQNIQDASSNGNYMVPAVINYHTTGYGSLIPLFTTVYATVTIGNRIPNDSNLPYARDDDGVVNQNARVNPDAGFYVAPNSMAKISDDVLFDILFDPDQLVAFNLYMRVTEMGTSGSRVPVAGLTVDSGSTSTEDGGMETYFAKNPSDNNTQTGVIANRDKITTGNLDRDPNGWVFLSSEDVAGSVQGSVIWSTQEAEASLGLDFMGLTTGSLPRLNELDSDYHYEFVVEFTYYNGSEDAPTWNGSLNMQVDMYGGDSYDLGSVADKGYTLSENSHNVTQVSTPADYSITKTFSDSSTPTFANTSPVIRADSTTGEISVVLNESRTGTVYYVLVPAVNPISYQPVHGTGSQVTSDSGGLEDAVVGSYVKFDEVTRIDEDYEDDDKRNSISVSSPANTDIMLAAVNPTNQGGQASGTISVNSGGTFYADVSGLLSNTQYFAMFVITGESGVPEDVYVYGFVTKEIERPIYTTAQSSGTQAAAEYRLHVDSTTLYRMITRTSLEGSTADSTVKALGEFILTNTELTNTFYAYISGEFDAEGDHAEKLAASSANHLTMSILDAMTTNYRGSGSDGDAPDNATLGAGYTFFDVFATDSLKDRVYNLMSSATAQAGGSDSLQVTAGTLTSAVVTEATYDTEYIFLSASRNNEAAYGANTPASEVFSFRSIENIYKPDYEKPVLVSASTTVGSYKVFDSAGVRITNPTEAEIHNSANTVLYSGALTLSFARPIYALVTGSSTTREIHMGTSSDFVAGVNGIPADAVVTDYLYFDDILLQPSLGTTTPTGAVSSLKSVVGYSPLDTMNIIITYTDIPANHEFTMFSGFQVASRNGANGGTLKFVLETIRTSTTTGESGMEITNYHHNWKWVDSWGTESSPT